MDIKSVLLLQIATCAGTTVLLLGGYFLNSF